MDFGIEWSEKNFLKWKVQLSSKIRKTSSRMNLKGWRSKEFNFDMLNFRS